MKLLQKSLILLVLIVSPIVALSQSSWVEMIAQPGAKLNDIRAAFEAEMKHKKYEKHSGYKVFKRWEYWAAFRQTADGSLLSNREVLDEAQAYWSGQSARSGSGNWIELGPMQEDNIYRGVGRMTSIAFHPTDPNTVLVGSPSAGVWISRDNGRSWRNNDESLANFGVSCISFDPLNPSTIYIGTGDMDANESYGVGVWKSTDGGQTYFSSNQGMGDVSVGKILVHPRNNNIVIACTKEGVFKSEDNGSSWRLTSIVRDFRDIEFMPGHPDTLYAADYNYFGGSLIYKSVDTGSTWERRWVFEGVFPDQRYEIEVSDADPNRVYAISRNRVLLSTNRADSFSTVLDSGDVLLEPQGWYNASFEVSNENPDLLFAGHVRLFRSQDGGKTWQRRNGSHADNHWLEINPHDASLWIADDGGIVRSFDEGRTFEDLTNMGIGAIYGIAQSPFKPMDVLQGYQDCGSKYYDGNKWHSVYGADGMLPLFDPTDQQRFYTSWQYGGLVRHLNGIGSGQNVKMPEDEGPWVTSFLIDGRDSSVMYTAREEIWRSDSLWANRANQVTWTSISTGIAKNTGGSFVKIAFARTDNKKMFAIWRRSSASKLIYCPDIYAASPDWIDLSNNYPAVAFSADFETDPVDDSIIYLLHDRNVLMTSDHGQNWTYLNNNLPRVPVYSLVVDTVTRDLYLGTDIGVFYKGFNEQAWRAFDNGMSKNARVTDLEIYYHPSNHPLSRIKASTYGRGVWESDLFNNDTTYFSFEPQTYLKVLNREKHSMTDTFSIQVNFRRHVKRVEVASFEDADLELTNAQVLSITGNADEYRVLLRANNYGEVSVSVPDSVVRAIDDQLFNAASNELRIWYTAEPLAIGYTGPAGVGDSSVIRAWFRSDEGIFKNDGVTEPGHLDTVKYWYDRSGHGLYAVQNTDSSKPRYIVDTLGPGGYPAIEFIPTNRFMRADGLTKPGKNITVFEVASSNTINWSSSGWIANARTPNGFVLHVNHNSTSMRSEVLSGRSRLQYLGAESNFASDIRNPHIYGIQWNEDQRKHFSILDDKKRPDNVGDFEPRDPNDTIYVRFGKDNWERWGDGKISEFLYFNVDLFEAKRILVTNYLAARYGLSLERESKYRHALSHPFDIIGIGRVSYYDYHDEAKGEGAVHIKDPLLMKDGSFLMLGHDGDSVNRWITDNVPTGKIAYKRIKRSWAVSQINDKSIQDGIGELLILIDSTMVPPGDNPVGIALSKSTDFTQAYYSSPLFLNADGKYETRIQLRDGDFFTLISGTSIEVGKTESGIGSAISLWPNPSKNGKAYLNIPNQNEGSSMVKIVDINGKLVKAFDSLGENSVLIDLSNQAPGMYIIHVENSARSESLKFIR